MINSIELRKFNPLGVDQNGSLGLYGADLPGPSAPLVDISTWPCAANGVPAKGLSSGPRTRFPYGIALLPAISVGGNIKFLVSLSPRD
jgi:hypothetical protein